MFVRATGVHGTEVAMFMSDAGMMIDRAITGIDDELHERMRVRVDRASAHLHGEQDEEHETEYTDEGEPPVSVSSLRSWRDRIEDVPRSQHGANREDLCRQISDVTTVGRNPSRHRPVRLS